MVGLSRMNRIFCLTTSLLVSLAAAIRQYAAEQPGSYIIPSQSMAIANALQLDPKRPVPGLAYGFYRETCPQAESLVRHGVQRFLNRTSISSAGGLIRLVFHDCFIQGCDASILLVDNEGEQTAFPNLTLRPDTFTCINEIKQRIEAVCPGIVSCSDIVVLASREALHQSGGPAISVPTGRLDGMGFAKHEEVDAGLPTSYSDIRELVRIFQRLGLNKTDLVTLSGAHTVGIAHCKTFKESLRRVRPEDSLDLSYAQALELRCTRGDSTPVELDPLTPYTFDNSYFANVLSGYGLFDSDRALLRDSQTCLPTVESFASNQTAFFESLAVSFVKMSMLNVLTTQDSPSRGNIRLSCTELNPPFT